MRNVIVGTAGHIDHGKTALIRALTGIDTDRLEEEKRRGISIDLGFAFLDLPGDLRVGFVDVPGHERFVKNMLAGVGGIDAVLFVIAADESIKPQTREHFDICRLLGIPKGIVVLTKSDLVGPEILDLVRLEVEEFLTGSFLEGAPMVAASAVTGEGLDELRLRLAETAAAVPPKDASRQLRLPIDRSFSMRGFGTVVTGTLVAGSVERDQEVEVHPGARRLRVRGIQVHGISKDRAEAGQRTALNLTGSEPSDLRRGMVITEPGSFQAANHFDCRFELLPSAKLLKNRAPIHFHSGSAEVLAEVRWHEGIEALQPGGHAWARLLLREPLLLLPGDRFIARKFSPVVTIGGGVILDISSRRYRRGQASARLEILHRGDPPDRVALLVRESEYGLGFSGLITRNGLTTRELESVARSGRFLFLEQPEPWLLDRDWVQTVVVRMTSALQTYHSQHPLVPGMPRQELRVRELPGAPRFLLDALLSQAPSIVSEGDLVRLASHKLVLKQDEEQALAAIEHSFERAGLAVPSTREVLEKSGVEPGKARSLLQMLLREKRLVRVGDELVFHASALDSLRRLLSTHKGERFTVPVFKDWTGISRKYAIPLLEYLDRERVTRRIGDEREVLSAIQTVK